MPIRVTTEQQLAAGDAPETGPDAALWDASLRRARILIIDDQPGMVEILRMILEQDGFSQIRATTDPLESIRLFGEFQPDLVLLDLLMPALSGWKVLAGLRAIMRADAPLPILVVSADRKAGTRSEALRRGASDFVAKPFDTADILARIKNLLEIGFHHRRKADEALRESEERFSSAFEFAPIGMALISLDGRLLKVNEMLCDLLGYSEGDLLIRTIQDITHPDDQGISREYVRRARAGEIRSYEFNKRYVHANGRSVSALTKGSIVQTAGGGPAYLIAQIQDVTEQQRAQAELFRSRETLRGILDQIPQRVFWKDRDSVLLGCNQAFAADMGLADPAAAIGMTDIDPTWQAMAEVYRNDDRLVMDQDTPKFSFEEPSFARDGSTLWIRTSKMPLHDEQGRVTGILGTYEDITEHKLAKLKIEQLNADLEVRVAQRTEQLLAATQEAEKANRAKGEFLSRTSHELRTPMNAILGFGQLLAAGKTLDPQGQDSVARILDAGRQLLALIDEILNIADAESGTMPFSLEPLAAKPLIEETLCLVQPLATVLGIELKVIHLGAGDWKVLADHRRLKQVLVNFLSNAVQCTRPGGAVIVECTRTEVAGSPMVRFGIRDGGPGFSAEKLALLFTPFEHMDAGRPRTPAADRGLGLALSRRLAEMMGGRVGLDSVLEEGSTFWVEAPLVETDASSAPPALRLVGDFEANSLSASIVLYIENDLSNLRLITRMLARRPAIRVHAVKTVSAAVELPAEVCPHLIVLDLPSAHPGGGEMLAQLHAHPRTANIPVAVLCAGQTPEQKGQMLEAGARACIPKPVQVRTLLRVVDHFTLPPPESAGAQPGR
jgi:PAS domain S-box-containing protein